MSVRSFSAKGFLIPGGIIDCHFAIICASVGSCPKETRSAIRARERFPCSVCPKNFSQIDFVCIVNMLMVVHFEPGIKLWYLIRQLAPLLFGNILELDECILAKVNTPLVRMTRECAVHDWVPLWVPMIVLLVQPEE